MLRGCFRKRRQPLSKIDAADDSLLVGIAIDRLRHDDKGENILHDVVDIAWAPPIMKADAYFSLIPKRANYRRFRRIFNNGQPISALANIASKSEKR